MEVLTSEVKKSTRLKIADAICEKGYLFGNFQGYLESIGFTDDSESAYILKTRKEEKKKNFFNITFNQIFGHEKYFYQTELICSIHLNVLDRKLGGWHIRIHGENNFEEVKKLTYDIAQALGVDSNDFNFILVSYKTTIRYVENSVVESYFK